VQQILPEALDVILNRTTGKSYRLRHSDINLITGKKFVQLGCKYNSDMKNLDINFTEHEASQLIECLSNLRKHIDQEYQYSGDDRKAIDDGVFRSACQLQYKMDKAFNPETEVTLDDYLGSGK